MATEGRSHDRLPLGGHLTTCVSPRPAALRGVILRFWIDILSLSTVQVFMPQTTTQLEFDSESIPHLLSRRDFSYDVPDRGKVATLT